MSIKNLRNLDWEELKGKLSQFATSAAGKENLLALSPLHSAELAVSKLGEIEECQEILKTGVRPFAESLDFFETWVMRLRKQAVLKPIEFRDARQFFNELLALKSTLKSFSSPFLQQSQKEILNAEEPLSSIDQVFTLGGDIRNDASEALFNLTREKENLWKQIHQTMDKLVKAFEMEPYLQDRYVTTRDGRWVLPVRGGAQHSVKGLIHGHSQTKQTVFIEPEEVVPMNNRLRTVEWEIEQEIERILTDLSQYLMRLLPSITHSRDLLFTMDVRLAEAQLAQKLNAKAAKFTTNLMNLKELKHPLLALENTEVVSNSIELNQQKRILLLTGPNAGGKTVLLKAIGLATQMARCGLPICAEVGSELPFFTEFNTAIGDAQSVDEHLSTFAAHLKALEAGTQLKGMQSLFLVDEICGSTDPDEGSALARSFIEAYSSANIFAVITSHLGPLKVGWTEESAVLQGSLQYDQKSGRPTYLFVAGIAGDSMALQTAKRVGINPVILNRAFELLSPEARRKQSSLDELEQIKHDLLQLQESLRKKEKQTEKEKERYQAELKRLEQEKDKELRQLLQKTKKEIDDSIAAAKADQTFKKFEKLGQIVNEMPEMIKASSPDNKPQITSAADFLKRYPPGSKVFVTSLNQDGLIQGEANSRGEIPILSNSLRLFVSWKDLRGPDKPTNPTGRILRDNFKGQTQLIEQDRSLDLRGKTVEEALGELEIALDNAFERNEERIKIIHGHGTEALKRAVRAYLSRSIYVKKWKAGNPESGGDGVTHVEIGES